jgi:hypothetical protein
MVGYEAVLRQKLEWPLAFHLPHHLNLGKRLVETPESFLEWRPVPNNLKAEQ